MPLLAAAPDATPELLANIGWLAMRLTIAWLFLWPLPGLLRDWRGTVGATALVFPMPRAVTLAGVFVMLLGAVSVAVGIYGRVGGAALAIYCVGGAFVHRALAAQPAALIDALKLPDDARSTAETAAAIGALGHTTSAWKNWTIAGACTFIALAGTGPWSVLEFIPLQLSP